MGIALAPQCVEALGELAHELGPGLVACSQAIGFGIETVAPLG